jgi:hypothetical protein
MTSGGSKLYSTGAPFENEEANAFITQQDNGNLVVRNGTPENPAALVWESGATTGSTEDSYYTVLQGDSNFITWRVPSDTSENKRVHWKTQTINVGTEGYSFVIECDTVAIYKGELDNNSVVWRSDPAPLSPPPTQSISPSASPSACPSDSPGSPVVVQVVEPSDTILLLPESQGTIIAPITAFTWSDHAQFPDDQFEKPIYKDIRARDDGSTNFWNYLVDELLLSRVDVVLLHGRGCFSKVSGDDGPGNMCPRVLRHFVSSVDRAQAQDVMKVGMFIDTAAIPRISGVEILDLAVEENWNYFWEYNIMIFFDIIPESMWFFMDGQPVISFWNLRDSRFKNQQGNASRMLKWIKSEFESRYLYTPAFLLQDDWLTSDTTIDKEIATGVHGWLDVDDDRQSKFSVHLYNEEEWGVVAPGFRDGNTLPGCGAECREVTRRGGAAFEYAMAQGNPKLTQLEGWTDMVESAGFYRSDHWEYPTQYINIVRKYADPTPATLRFQAEGADYFYDLTDENIGGDYADRALDVKKFEDDTGWYVQSIQEGEWLEYKNVKLGCGTYRFTARAAAGCQGKKMTMVVGGEPLPTVDVPSTGGLENFGLVHLGEIELTERSYDLRMVFNTEGGLHVDWFFVKRSKTCSTTTAPTTTAPTTTAPTTTAPTTTAPLTSPPTTSPPMTSPPTTSPPMTSPPTTTGKKRKPKKRQL